MQEVVRQEKKYLLTYLQFRQMEEKLSKVLHADENGQENGYCVRSLYFDTFGDTDFFEKEDGVECRRKIRLRTYGADTEFAKLEMKQKQGSGQKKRSLNVTREDAEAISNGDYSCLLNYKESFAEEMYAYMTAMFYRPKAIVEYRRKAYMVRENNIRITFDYEIKATESSFDLFSDTLNQNPVFDNNFVVMEVKYNGFLLSYIKDLLNVSEKSQTSVSKYCLSRSIGLHYQF